MAMDFVAGFLGGCAGIVVGYPLDTIKVHIQTQDHRNPKYKGTWDCFRTLVAKDSVRGLYRGVSSPMAGVAVVNSIVFGVYSQTYKYLHQCPEDEEENEQQRKEKQQLQEKHQQALTGYFIAGVSAGLAQSPVSSPIELAKTRLQLQTSATVSGPIQCLYRIHKTEGLRRGVFRGFGTTLMREAPSYGVYFATYELLTRTSPEDGPISTAQILLAGGLAGTASWVVSYPIDVVKSRLQADAGARYSGPIDCFRKSIRSEGYSCMFRGLSSTIIRAFPTNAATFAVVTWTMRLFGNSEDSAQNSRAKSSETEPLTRKSQRDQRAVRFSDTTLVFDSEQQQQQLLSSFFAMPQNHLTAAGTASNKERPVQLDKHEHHVQTRHFDESLHFEWTQAILHN